MNVRRLRIFGGPNGSGKTTIINELIKKISFGVYVNADDIEQSINENNSLDLTPFSIALTNSDVQGHFKSSLLSPVKFNDKNLWKLFSVLDNKLIIEPALKDNSYASADIAELIRQTLLKNGKSFCMKPL